MGSPTTYFLANRLWWAGTLFIAPIIGTMTQPMVAIGVAGVLALLSLLVLDTDRPWWSTEVRQVPSDQQRTQVERRKLTLWSLAGLLAGLAVALLGPW